MTDTLNSTFVAKDSNKLSMVEKCGYGLGDMAGNFVYMSVTILLGFFYTEIYGLDAATVASIFLVVRIFDAINDPIIGYFVDKTNTRWGKCKPWLIVLCIPYALSSIAVFTVPELEGAAKIIYAYVTYGVLMLLFTMTNIPYGALTAKMTADPVEREKLNSVRFIFATGGGLIITSCVLPLAEWYSDDPAIGYQFAMMVMAAISVVMFIITLLTTKERISEPVTNKTNIKEDLKVLFENKHFLMLTIITFMMVMGQLVKGTTQMFYMNTYVEDGAKYITWFLSAWMIGGMIGASLASSLLKILCKKKAFMYLHYASALLSLAAMVIGNTNIVLIVGLSFCVGFINQMIAPVQTTFIFDTQDCSELEHGKRFDGMALSFVLFSLKMALSVGGALAMWSLSLYGYESGGVEQTPEAKEGILFTFSVVPAVIYIVTALLISRFKLDSKTIEENSIALEKQRHKLRK